MIVLIMGASLWAAVGLVRYPARDIRICRRAFLWVSNKIVSKLKIIVTMLLLADLVGAD